MGDMQMFRRTLVFALMLLIGLANDAHAEGERVLIDATFRAIPLTDSAPCMLIDAGRLTVYATNRDDVQIRPVTFRLYGYRGMDPNVKVEMPVSQQESSVTVPLAGALYCWSIDVEAPVRFDDGMAIRTNYTQLVAVKLVWS